MIIKQLYLTLIILVLANLSIHAQKVASYSYGKYGTNEYEQFSFWIKANKKADIYYQYGKNAKELKLKYFGTDTLNGKQCFKIQFRNKYVLYFLPKENQLQATDATGKYLKYFIWKYEGPVNGIGTFCEPCAEDETEAMELIMRYFMK